MAIAKLFMTGSTDDSSGFSSLLGTVGGALFWVAMWPWSFALLGGVVWAIKQDGLPVYNDEQMEEAVDALLRLDT